MIIYASNGRQKADIPVDDNSTQVMELQGDNVLNLSFTLYEYVALEVNDYSEYMGRRYWLMERPRPEQASTVEWKYDIKLYGIESLVKRFLVLHDTDGADEAVFTLTAPAREHVALVVASVNRGMGSGDWKVGMVEATGNLVIDYRGTFCHDALRQIAAQAGPRVEWWVEGQTVNLCRCEQGEEVTLAYDTGLTSLSCSTAEGFYTRLYPIGSSRNIDPQKYGHSRLQLPGGVKHVDVGVERYGMWHRFETDAFATIYPRYIGTVTSVRREERKDKEGRSFTAWFFSDSSLPFDPNAYEIGGRVKRVSFQEGAELAGLGSEEDGTYYFEANFDSRTREWELITLWPHDDDTQLPGGQLVPKPGDRYIPWNIRMPDEYYPLAEREFREAVDRYNTEHAVDAAVYKALTDYLYLEEHDITLRLGSRVRLESAQYFPDTGFRCSRVTKITRRINRPSRMELEMSDARPAGMMESLHEDIADARRLVYRMTDGLPDVVRTNDSTPPSDSNVLSALRALATFLRKDRPDAMPHLLKLLDGLETGTFAAGRTGGRIDRAGNGELGSLTLRDLLTAARVITGDVRSKNYTPGDMGTGFGLTTGEGGSLLEVDYLLVRRVATFLELLIREMRHVGGTLVLSGASGKVVRVEDKASAWRVHFKTREDGTTVAHGFTVGAQARCQTYNRTSGNTYYWRLVTAVGDDWVELSKSDYDRAAPTGTARTAPAVGDELVQLGHRTDARQTGAIVLDTVGEGAPSIRLLKDIRSYSLTDANVRVLLSPSAVRVIADEVSFASGKTVEQTIKDSKENAIEAAKEYVDGQKKGIDDRIGEVSGKVDNLVIGGRNLLINTQFTKRDSYQTVRGTYRIELDSVERYQGSNSLKLTNTKAGKIYEDVLVSGEQPAAGEYITVSLYAKAATAGTILSVRVCDNGEVQQTAALTTAWQRISFTFHALKAPSRAIGIWYDRADTVWVALPKMEVGNKVTDWSPAPEDVASDAVAKANQALADAKSYTNAAKNTLDSSISAAQTAAQTAQKNLDNLTIGGRNLLRYSALEKTPLNNIVYGRKPENAPVGVEEGYQGAKAVKLVFTTPGKMSVNEVMWRTWEERTDHNRVEPVVLRFWAKADKDNTRMWTVLGYHGGKFANPTISSEWKEYTVNFMPDGPWALWCIGLDAPGTVWISRPKLEYGTKPTDWTPAPEDVDSSIDGVRNTANQASADAGDAKQKAGEAATSAKTAETKAGEAAGSAKNAATSAKTASDKATNAANSASAAAGSAQTAATNAQNAAGSANAAKADAAQAKADAAAAAQSANASKEAADAAKTRLDNWAADNVISPMEKQGLRDETARIDADKSQVAAGYAKYGLGSYQSFTDAYNAYRAVLVTLSAKQPETISIPADFATKQRNYYTQRSTALTRIADAAKEYVDGLQIGGRNLVPGTSNDWKQYQLRSVTNLTIGMGDILTPGLMEGEYISMSMDIHWKGITVQGTPGAVTQSEGNVSGWFKGQLNHNFTTLITSNPNEGYARLTHVWKMTKDLAENEFFKYGFRFDNMSGMFEYRRLMVVRGQKPMDWQPAPEDWVTKINDAKSAGTAAADALDAYKKTVSETFHDGIIQEAEALAIEKYRNIVNSEFGALTNTYNAINGNAYLEGTAKSALANAFNALRAAKDALITSVNNAISDKRVTEDEKQAVDAKYNAYQSAYAAYSAALETANGSIHAKLKGLADKAANDIQVGGRNLIPDSDNGLLKRFIIHQPNNAPRYSTVDGWWRMAFDRDKQIVSRELTMSSVGTVQGLRKGNLAFSILCRTDGRIVSENLKISFFGGGVHRYVPANIENCGNNTYRIWGVYMNYPVSDLRVPDFMFFSTADATYVEFRYPKLEYGTKPTDWTPAPEDITSEIAAKTEAARQAAQSEAIGLNKWIAQAYYTGENKAATPPKLEDIAGKTPTRTVELKDAQFNLSGNGSVFNMDNYTGIRTTYVYLEADYSLTTGIQHDDAGSLYVNGALVASGPLQTASWKSVTLPLKRGWNRIDGLWNEGGGGDFFKFQAPLENDAHIIQLACRPNVSIDPMRAVTMERVAEQEAGFNTFNKQFTAWSESTEKTLTEYNNGLTKLTERVTKAELELTHEKIWLGISEKVTDAVNDKKQTLVDELKSKTGIDIQQGVITLDAQKVKVQNGSQTMAMFEGGKLKADLIDASRIDAGKLNASQIFSGTIDARNATFNNLTVSQGSKLGGWKVQGSDLVSDAATNASIRIEHRGKFLTSDESNPIEINNSTGNTLLIDGSRSSVQAEVTLTGKINNIRALSELSPAGLYTNLAAQEYKYGSLGAVVANVMYMPSGRSFRTAGVVGRIHDSAPNRNASYKKGFNGVFGENLRADGLMLGARDLTGDGTVYSIENLMTDTVLLIRGRPIIDLSNTPAELKGKFFFIFTHTGTRVRFKKDGRITQDNNAWNIFLLFNGSTWEVRSWDCDYREF